MKLADMTLDAVCDAYLNKKIFFIAFSGQLKEVNLSHENISGFIKNVLLQDINNGNTYNMSIYEVYTDNCTSLNNVS